MIEVKNLSFSYNESDYSSKSKSGYAIKDMSFQVNSHEHLAIIGHNGSGKSTLAKLLVGLLEGNGSIIYDGVELSSKTVDQIRKNVGIVFQNPDNQFVGFNVRYDVAFGLENHNIERQEMERLIEEYTKKVDMYEYLQREPQTLSGGQKQRVAIAGILALNSDVIILDEATSMLDPKGTEDIINLIKELKEKYNKTIITITHDLTLAGLADRIIVLKSGRIIKEGTPNDVFNDYETLVSSNLDMPFKLKAYYAAKNNEKLNSNNNLMELLWEYHLKA